MPGAHISGDANAVGALALALGDRLRDATEQAAGLAGALPAALVALHEFAGDRPIDYLAGALRVTHSRGVRIVDRLEEAGLARRVAAPEDRRAVHVVLTARGRRLARRVAEARAVVLAEALDGLDAELFGRLAGRALANLADTRVDARQICRLCDVQACGHDDGRCPVTNAVNAKASL
jgi:MarR family transcriptional regulator for hemolysin